MGIGLKAREPGSDPFRPPTARVLASDSGAAAGGATAERGDEASRSWLDAGIPRPVLEGGVIPEVERSPTARLREAIYRRLVAVADMGSAFLAILVGTALLGDDHLTVAAVAAVPFVVLVGKVLGLFDRDMYLVNKTTLDEAPRLFQAATLYALLLWLAESIFVEGALGKTQVLGLWGLLFFSMMVGRFGARATARAFAVPERCLVVGDRRAGEWVAEKLESNPTAHAQLIGRVPFTADPAADSVGDAGSDYPEPQAEHPVLGPLPDLGLVISEHRIDRVIVTASTADHEMLLRVIRMVRSVGVHVSVLPGLFEAVGSSVEFDDLHGTTLLGLRSTALSRSSRLLKRVSDVVGAFVAGLVLAPVWVGAAVAVRMSSPGPILFRQPRIGRAGKDFTLLKFRTMVDDAELLKDDLRHLNEASGLFKIADDPRITSVGRFLRRSSIDEIPQLLNVIRGDMSLVGPRPLVPEDDLLVEGWGRRRLQLRPGMTGLWQIFGSSRIPIDEMVKIDYLYSANWSPWLDAKVVLRTIPYVLARRGL